MGGASSRLGHAAHLALHPPFPSHGLIPVQAARDRSCLSAPITLPDRRPTPSPPPSLRSVVTSVPAARPPRHRPRPHRRRRPLTTQRNGSAHPPLPKSACLSASCRANAPARPDRVSGPARSGRPPSRPPARPVRARLGPPHPLSIWPARRHGPGRRDDPPGLPDSNPPPPGKDSVPTARTRCQPPDPIHHRAHRTAVG